MLSAKAEHRLQSMFSGQGLIEALQTLPEQLASQGEAGYENVVLAILKLSEGSLVRLRYFAERARSFPGDVILLARAPKELGAWPKSLEALLRGGPVALADVEPQPFTANDDLWERNGFGAAVFCVVCGELVSMDVFSNQLIELSCSTPEGFTRKKLVAVHEYCANEGKAIAKEQGFGWDHETI
jgi:hypothetical protein